MLESRRCKKCWRACPLRCGDCHCSYKLKPHSRRKESGWKRRGIRLVDRTELGRMMRAIYELEVPEFDWDYYNQHVKYWKPC